MKFYKPSKNQSGATLPTLDTPATAAEIEEGKEAIDGSGNKITGTLGKYASGSIFTTGNILESGGSIVVDVLYNKPKKIIEDGDTLSYYQALNSFGNATAADVAKGKTFTSIAGLNAIGTKEESTIANKTKYIIKHASTSSGKLWVEDDEGLGEYVNAGSQIEYAVLNDSVKLRFACKNSSYQNLGTFDTHATTEILNGELIKVVTLTLFTSGEVTIAISIWSV